MWTSVVLFVLTFAVLGLLLGFAAVYDTNQEGQMGNGTVIGENLSENATQANQSSSPDLDQRNR
jgi:hypothetical protein